MKRNGEETKKIILNSAIELFYKKGYDQVSIRTIADSVGIKGSSIYNHFKSKEDILIEMVNYHKEYVSNNYKGTLAGVDMESITSESKVEDLLILSYHQTLGNLATKELQHIFHILSRNQLSHPIVSEYLNEILLVKAREGLKKLFDKMNELNIIHYSDTELLAHEFYSYIIYLYYDHYLINKTDEPMEPKLKNHIRFFSKAIGVQYEE